jgi:hypothetical protein
LREIDAEIARLKQKRQDDEKCESIESEKRRLEILRQRVPDSPRTDQLLQYMNSLRRAIERFLTLYERAQRIRKGQPLPPELDVKIS